MESKCNHEDTVTIRARDDEVTYCKRCNELLHIKEKNNGSRTINRTE